MRRILILLFVSSAAFAQKPSEDDAFLDAMYAVRTFHSVAISPNGKKVTWAERKGGITVANADGTSPRRLTTGDEEYVAWSPDSGAVAYVGGSGARKQLFVVRGAEAAKQITNVSGFLAEPRWSPDGKSIAFLFIENAKRAAGPLVAMSRAVGPIEEHIDEQRVAVVDVATKKLRIVTPADMYVYHFDWSPDGKQLAAIAAPGSGDNNYWIAKLHVVDVAAATMKAVYTPQLQIANPRWSPDGARIAFIEGLMSDEGSTGGDLMVFDVGRVLNPSGRAGEPAPHNLTADLKASVTTFEWTGKDQITAGINVAGESEIAHVRAGDGAMESVWRGAEMVSERGLIGASLAHDGVTSAVIRSSFHQPPEVWAGPIGKWKQVTHRNDAVSATWGAPRSVHWKSDDFDVQGWLLAPAETVRYAHRYPVVVWIHGGPASASLARWPDERAALLSKKGYFVFFPNPRGSYGQGEAFVRANVKDFGGGDLRDVMAGLDAIAKQAPVDVERAGIWGWSYGGYMTMWTVTQTQRFKAAVAGAGIVNWVSYYGENDIDQWMIPYFGASVYDDPAVYAKSAPITFIKQAKTPTLVLVGERDGECPAPQSFEFWHALKANGTETQLVVYPDEGHAFQQPEHKRDVARRLVGWFDSHLR
jgi:dipeptidyl aminopeptidase/acylaminoacyl peptidase